MTFYGTAAGFRDYHTARGRDVTDYPTLDVEAALLIASEWIDAVYFPPSWPYYKTGGSAQVRHWPAIGVIDGYGYAVPKDTVPYQVENATYEAALRHLQSPTALSPDYTPNKYKRVSIHGSVSVDYAGGDAQSQYPIIDLILESLLGGGGRMSALSGAVARV